MTRSQPISNFRKVGEFHTVFEHPIKEFPDVEVFESNPKLVNLRYSLIEEETKEFLDAVESCDIVEMIDALADIDYVVHGAGLAFGINMDTMQKLSNIPARDKNIGSPSEFFKRTPPAVVEKICQDFRKLLSDLKSALDSKNIMEIAVVFLKFVEKTYEVAAALNIDLDEAFGLVHSSNMTKACVDEVQANETLDKYKEDLSVYKDPAIKQSADGKYWIVYDRSTGKTLKNKYYKAVDLKPLVAP